MALVFTRRHTNERDGSDSVTITYPGDIGPTTITQLKNHRWSIQAPLGVIVMRGELVGLGATARRVLSISPNSKERQS